MPSIVEFEISFHQFLDEQGKLINDDPPELAKDFDELRRLYQIMVETRVFDSKAVALQRTGKMGTYASSLGHEAVHVGIGSAMAFDDVFAPMYREYGAQFCRGVQMHEVLRYWGGDERGSDFSGPAHDFPWCVPIATQCLHAAGAALSFQLRKQPRVGVCVVGDGGSSKGDFLETINAAGAWQLPLVMVIVNNQWAISVPRSQQSGGITLAQKGVGGGVRSGQVDGNDILAVRWAMDRSLARAREGGGPTLIEMVTYRLSDHTTADDASRYRPAEEVEDAWRKEPLIRLRRYLEDQNQWDEAREEQLLRAAEDKVEAEVALYIDTGPPPPEAMFDHLFAHPPEEILEQRKLAMQRAAIERGPAHE